MGFPGSSTGKKSTCNAVDPGSILGQEDPLKKGDRLPLQYSWASLVAQMLSNLPAMRETWLQSLGWEDPLEKRMDGHSMNSIYMLTPCHVRKDIDFFFSC